MYWTDKLLRKKKDLGCEFICNLLQTSTVIGKQVAYLVGYMRRY